jgi:hypothetical protein
VAEEKRLKKPLPVPDDPDVEVEAAEDAEEDVLEDTSDLEDDTDPLGADIEVEPDTDEPER